MYKSSVTSSVFVILQIVLYNLSKLNLNEGITFDWAAELSSGKNWINY